MSLRLDPETEVGGSRVSDMFAPLILPFQITVVLFAVGMVVAARSLRSRLRIVWLTLVPMLLFIPSCAGVMLIVDLVRYGRFDYASANEIPRDGYIHLPPTATKIELHRNGAGHWAKFVVSTEDLREWVREQRSCRPDLNSPRDDEWIVRRDSNPELQASNQKVFESRFPDTGWSYDPGMIEVHVTRSARGGGFTIWHIPSSGVTYLRASYW